MRESNRHLHIIFDDNYYDDLDDHFDDYSDCDDFDDYHDLNDDDCDDPDDDYDHGLVDDKSNRPCHQL